jgi:fatty-acid desaturase
MSDKQVVNKQDFEKSNRWLKSATPKQTTDWYVKWVASIFVLMGMSIRGLDGLQLFDLTFSMLGVSLWLWVSIIWNDRALIILNSAGFMFLAKNMLTLWLV